jgi:signal transduction histidine kinase/ActR/RegA family two-component response regulator
MPERELDDALERSLASREILLAFGRQGDQADQILDTIVERAARLCHADASLLFLLDDNVFRLSRISGEVTEAYQRQVTDHPNQIERASVMGRAVLDRRTQRIDDVLQDPEYGRQDLQVRGGFRTLLESPMLYGDDVVGVLLMWRTKVDPFDDRDVWLLEDFAAQAAIALWQAELTSSLEARTAELASKVEQLEALREVGEVVSSTLDPDIVLDSIVSNAVRLTGTDGGSIMEYLEETDAFVVRAAYGSSPQLLDRLHTVTIRRNDSLVGRAVTERRTIQVADLAEATSDAHLDALLSDGWRSVLAIPMIRGDVIIGALVIRRRIVGSFPDEMVDLLETFAAQSTVALVNARLFRELETKSAELEVASRHKSEFLASMSHELRTPLNAVIGFSEVLIDRMFGELNERQDEYVRDIWNSGRHLLELLNEILDLSKVEAGQMVLEPTTVDVAQTLDYAVSLVRERAAKHGITVDVAVGPGIDVIETDPLRFKQVMLNLLSNAVKFTSDGGRVDITAEVVDDDLVIAVTDTGPGIPEADRERIFDSFQQGGRGVAREEGTGLGLTLSRRIVELFGGRLWLESEVGRGSTFAFTIPLGRAPQPSGPAGSEPPDRPTVLLVDDDLASLDLIDAYLQGTGVRLERAMDGSEALRLAREIRPSGIILDLRMPRVDGWQVLDQLQDDPSTSALPIVIVSVVDDRLQGLARGAAEYLIKPVSRDDLLAALSRAGVITEEATP